MQVNGAVGELGKFIADGCSSACSTTASWTAPPRWLMRHSPARSWSCAVALGCPADPAA